MLEKKSICEVQKWKHVKYATLNCANSAESVHHVEIAPAMIRVKIRVKNLKNKQMYIPF